jgi:hypothetical protein
MLQHDERRQDRPRSIQAQGEALRAIIDAAKALRCAYPLWVAVHPFSPVMIDAEGWRALQKALRHSEEVFTQGTEGAGP